ncbi:MAG: hypothetical protein M0Z33_00835, partial [Actinomycetota bacterium]|nr:hypothetical protein [Actinomycetota bacterium]
MASVGAALVVLLPARGASGAPVAPPSASQVDAARHEAAALEARIARDTRLAAVAGERYDQATVVLGRDRHAVEVLRVELARDAARSAAARDRVRSAAVEAYVYGDSAAAQFGAVLTSSIAEASTITAYTGAATDHLESAVLSLLADEARLESERRAESAAVGRATQAVASASSARKAAEEASAASSSALARVKGRIATYIAEQEAAAAAAAAARARAAAAAAARAKAAQRARALAEQQAAEAQAAAAASVASAVAG